MAAMLYTRSIPRFLCPKKLFLRLLRRLPPWVLRLPVTHNNMAHGKLYKLTLPNRQSFETAARLRSGSFHNWEISSRHRLAQHLEEPYRTSQQKLIASATKFRNVTKPRFNWPLGIPLLAHPSFRPSLS